MGTHRELAIAAMKAISARFADDFMHQAGIPMPEAIVPGALPAMVRETVPAATLSRLVDMAMIWTLGDYADGLECSRYFDPTSPWYNVIYGAYGLRSYKRDGSAWGFRPNGEPDWEEFFQITEVDYNFLTATQFGCPASELSFQIHSMKTGSSQGWFWAETHATVPSGLHDFTATLGDPEAYVMYGIPSPTYLAGEHRPYEPVKMHGQVFLRQMTSGPQPISMAWGVTCPDTPSGNALRDTIMKTLAESYLPLALPRTTS
jgi:hypothetical protein